MVTSKCLFATALVQRLQLAAIIIASIPIMFACRKTDMQAMQQAQQKAVEKFLALPPYTAAEVKRVAALLKDRHERTGFLKEMVRQNGFALWDKAIIGSNGSKKSMFARSGNSSSDTIIYIPLALENANHVNAFIYATLNGSIELRFYRATDYERFGFGSLQSPARNADKLAVQFMLLDYNVFGHSDFNLLDDRLLKDTTMPLGTSTRNRTVHIEPATNMGSRYEIHTVTLCNTTSYLQCTTNHSCCPDGSCPACQAVCWHTKTVCTSFTTVVFVDDDNWGGGSNGPGSGMGGGVGTGGSGGIGGPTPGCNPTPIIDNGELPCIEGDMNGWQPLLTRPPSTEEYLKKLVNAVHKQSDSIYALSLAHNPAVEYGFLVCQRATGEPYARNIKTDGLQYEVNYNRNIQPDETIVALLHTHPDSDTTLLQAPSDGDLSGMRKFGNRQNFTKIVECGTKRYALVITDPVKAITFFNNHSEDDMEKDNIQYLESNLSNSTPSIVTEKWLLKYLGPSGNCGIGLYIATNLPEKNNFKKLN